MVHADRPRRGLGFARTRCARVLQFARLQASLGDRPRILTEMTERHLDAIHSLSEDAYSGELPGLGT